MFGKITLYFIINSNRFTVRIFNTGFYQAQIIDSSDKAFKSIIPQKIFMLCSEKRNHLTVDRINKMNIHIYVPFRIRHNLLYSADIYYYH